MRYLIDTNTFRHPATSHWEHQEDELLLWGNTLIGVRRYQWRFKSSASREIAVEIPYVPALGREGSVKGLQFFTYQLLDWESWTVRPSVDWARRSIRSLFQLQNITPKYQYRGILIGRGMNISQVIREFIDSVQDKRLDEFKKILGPKHSQDAFHLFVCEHHGIDGLVTLDLKLHRHFQRSRKRLKTSVQVFLPSEVCQIHSIGPVGADWFAEGKNDVFSNNIVQLFSRTATRKDILIYSGYRCIIWLRDRFNVPVKFIIPGY
jgi:hypothetical protein